MINISVSLRQNAQSTAKGMNRDNISVAGIQDAEGFVLIKCDSGYVCSPNSVLQAKISLDGVDYWLCEGSAEKILNQKK